VHWTTASLIAPLPANPAGPWPVWVSFGTPCTGLFLPLYLDGLIPHTLARGGEEPEPDSAWWTFKRLQDAVSADPVAHTPIVREGWAELEEKIEAERHEVEGAARTAAVAGDRDRAAEIASDFMARTVEEALKRAEALRARLD
jgi:dipeptidase